MKKTFFFFAIGIYSICNAQTWNLTGNSGTNSATNYLGTSDNQNLVFKTNNIERIKIISGGGIKLVSNSLTDDGLDIINETQNMNNGTDLVWIKSKYQQPNDVGMLTISTYNWQYPIFSARENGKIFMGTNVYNYKTPNCTDCNSYRLFVKDGIKTEKVKVEIAAENGWADYVFNNDYKLLKINELDNFIKLNKHLPEVPSTEEAIKNGIELKEMNILLLKKIEELTLYIIEQNKRIEKLENTQK